MRIMRTENSFCVRPVAPFVYHEFVMMSFRFLRYLVRLARFSGPRYAFRTALVQIGMAKELGFPDAQVMPGEDGSVGMDWDWGRFHVLVDIEDGICEWFVRSRVSNRYLGGECTALQIPLAVSKALQALSKREPR